MNTHSEISNSLCMTKIILPIALVEYLSHDKNSKNPRKFSRLKAFNDLIMRYQSTFPSGVGKEKIHISQLTTVWGWSRPTVGSFINDLNKFDIIDIEATPTAKYVTLKSHIFSPSISSPPQNSKSIFNHTK